MLVHAVYALVLGHYSQNKSILFKLSLIFPEPVINLQKSVNDRLKWNINWLGPNQLVPKTIPNPIPFRNPHRRSPALHLKHIQMTLFYFQTLQVLRVPSF